MEQERNKLIILQRMKTIDDEIDRILSIPTTYKGYEGLYYKRLPMLQQHYTSLIIQLVLSSITELKEEIRRIK